MSHVHSFDRLVADMTQRNTARDPRTLSAEEDEVVILRIVVRACECGATEETRGEYREGDHIGSET